MNPVIERLGWMLLHSLWEGAAVWLLLQLALLVLRRKSAQARYLAACVALAAMALLPWLTFGSMDLFARMETIPAAAAPPSASAPTVVASLRAEPVAPETGSLQTIAAPKFHRNVVDALLPWLVGGWALGVIIFAGRLWVAWRSVRRLVRTPLQALPPGWQVRLEELRHTAGIRGLVRAGETTAVIVPVVLGWLKPVILLPVGVIAQFPAEQLEAILLHELAHVRRHDFLVNLLQCVVETLFFYHPAVRSVSRRMRDERERACDDLSVEWCRDPMVYAGALTMFEEYRRESLALAVTGEGDLLVRIRRVVLGIEPRQHVASFFAAAGFLALGGYIVSMFLAPLLAAELMTDRERVARIESLQPPPNPGDSYGAGENVFVRGTLKTEDGQPLPGSLFERSGSLKQSRARITSSLGGGMTAGGLMMEEPSKQTYGGNTRTGRIEIGVWAEGYAPLRKTILQDRGGDITADLLLRRGFPAKVRITDPDGKPIMGASLVATSCNRRSTQLEISMPTVVTDENGMATIGNVEVDSEVRLSVSKPDWQMMNQMVSKWSPQSPVAGVLEAARPTSGTVIDRATRQPAEGAEIILAARRGAGDSYVSFSPEDGQMLGRSDREGHFSLETLAQSGGYYVYVRAKGYPTQSFPIAYGQQNRVCELEQGLRLSGKILDPKGLLASGKYFHPITLEAMYTLQATPFNGYGESERLDLAKLGPEIPFAFENLPAGPIAIMFSTSRLEHYRYELNLQKDTEGFVIDFGNPQSNSDNSADPRPLRTLQISFQTDSQEPVTGSLDAGYLTTLGKEQWITPKIAAIENDQATLKLPVPTKAYLYPDQINGYWFPPETLDFPTGSEPVSRTIKAVRAGVIHGRINPSPAFENQYLSISPVVIRSPSGLAIKDLSKGSRSLSSRNDYVTQPLPFGGVYAVVVAASPSYFMTEPAVVDAGHPIVPRDLALERPTGALKGKFVDEMNRPIPYQEVLLSYHPNPNDVFSSHSATTGEDGTFTISGINFSIPGNYEVRLNGDRWAPSEIRIDGNTPQPVIIKLRKRASGD